MSEDNVDAATGVDGGIGPGHEPAAASAGWHPDPWAAGQRRYWNGHTWTPDVFADRTVGEQAGVAARQGRTSPFQDRVVDGGAVDAPPAPNWTAPTPAVAYLAPPIIRPLSPEPSKSRTALAVSLSAAVALAVVLVLLFAFLRPGSSSTAATGTPSASPLLPSPSASSPSTSPLPTPQPSGGATSPLTPVPGSPGQPGSGGTAQTDPQAAALQNLGLRQTDVTRSMLVGTIAGGDQVAHHPTLDLCNANYSSEALRTARHQVAAVDPAGNALLSTEAVLYQNEGAAKLALAELRLAAVDCPATPVTNPTTGQPQTTVLGPAPDKTWPAVTTITRQAYQFTSTDQTSASQAYVAVYLQRGRVLLAVYFFHPTGQQTSVDNQRTVQGITAVFENRLAALPASAVANP
jgi:hypothetical protein